MGFWWAPLADVLSKNAQANMINAAIAEMQKGHQAQSLMLYGMVLFAAMLAYILIDAKRQTSKLTAKIDNIQQKFADGIKEQYKKDLALVQSTTEAITSFNSKFPDLMNFVRNQSSTVEALTPKIDSIAGAVDKIKDGVIELKKG